MAHLRAVAAYRGLGLLDAAQSGLLVAHGGISGLASLELSKPVP